jgi:hypothetical protein
MTTLSEEINLKYLNTIYIVESPSPEDINDDRIEGKALSAALDLAQINNKYYKIEKPADLVVCFDLIANHIIETRKEKIPMPILHFSMHGNEHGISLTDQSFIEWSELRKGLMILNQKVEFVNSFGQVGSRFSLSMSVCEGIFAYKIYQKGVINPFWSLVGPTKVVNWSDSLVAFIVFYHNLIFKRSMLIDAVEKMNNAAGLNEIFKVFLDDRLRVEKSN